LSDRRSRDQRRDRAIKIVLVLLAVLLTAMMWSGSSPRELLHAILY